MGLPSSPPVGLLLPSLEAPACTLLLLLLLLLLPLLQHCLVSIIDAAMIRARLEG